MIYCIKHCMRFQGHFLIRKAADSKDEERCSGERQGLAAVAQCEVLKMRNAAVGNVGLAAVAQCEVLKIRNAAVGNVRG